jgi:hypothetical protein
MQKWKTGDDKYSTDRKGIDMQWIIDNWIWILVIGGMLGMHLFGHGHGKKGHGGGHDVKPKGKTEPVVSSRLEKENIAKGPDET